MRPLHIEAFTPPLAARIPRFVYKIFGYSNPDVRLYSAEAVVQDVATGRRDLLVCTDSQGEIRGIIDITYSFPSPHIAEINELLIDPELPPDAGGSALKLLLEAFQVRIRFLADTRSLRSLVSLEVTEHQLTQRLAQQMGFTTAGVFLGQSPGWQRLLKSPPLQRHAAVENIAESPSLRRNMVVSVRPFRTRTPPQILSVPARYEGLIREIYTDFRVRFEFAQSPAPAGETVIHSEIDHRRRLAVVEIVRAGSGAADAVLERLRHFRRGFLDVVRLVLPLAGVDIGEITERLVEEGCGFAAVFPQYRESPVLVLQHVDKETLAPVESGVLTRRATRLLESLTGANGRNGSAAAQPALRGWMHDKWTRDSG
jgi:hypothetical protein